MPISKLTDVSFCLELLIALHSDRLSVIVLKDTEAALRASILFCFNPASIFYSSV